MDKQLAEGNEAVVLGALLGGATHFFGYPITPASEIAHAAAHYFPSAGRHFLQAESEVSAINMIYGASSSGARAMTASSGPGISLMAEGISYLAGAELPAVIVDIQRVGPGLGYIWPEQGDYRCVVKGGGHGCYKNIVFAPATVQEMCDFTYRSFALADRFRMTVYLLSDAYIGQMVEPIVLPQVPLHDYRKEWALYGDSASRKNIITSIYVEQKILSALNIKLQEKYRAIERELVEYEETMTGDAEVLLVAYGISARISLSAVKLLRDRGVKAGLFRLKTLFPFPKERLKHLSAGLKSCIAVELANGQMAEDVELSVASQCPVLRYNWYGGIIPSAKEIAEKVVSDLSGTTV
ncbi:MAG: 3-methyl-2-oxobutanoate dehydrogenase subunit VorB [Chitinispirillaceae bacterium]|nr:3-methyl-2-oxobutanoate dehydrogenase subunit VorB [Chitinispirillaceae bacterium]